MQRPGVPRELAELVGELELENCPDEVADLGGRESLDCLIIYQRVSQSLQESLRVFESL